MALDALANCNDLFNYMLNETNVAQCGCDVGNLEKLCNVGGGCSSFTSPVVPPSQFPARKSALRRGSLGVQGRKKRRRRPKVCKNKEEAETQRMTHITVERNRRKQMNEHLAVLRSLMPQSYAQRGDQASIVGGAIEFVKELEHLLHSFEAQKLLLLQQAEIMRSTLRHDNTTSYLNAKLSASPFTDLFSDSERPSSQISNKYTLRSKTSAADIEVTLIETHANLRILSKKTPCQLSKLVLGLQTLGLIVLHLSVTSLDPLVLYSISAKLEEGCQLSSVDSIAEAVHHMFKIIEENDASLLLTY